MSDTAVALTFEIQVGVREGHTVLFFLLFPDFIAPVEGECFGDLFLKLGTFAQGTLEVSTEGLSSLGGAFVGVRLVRWSEDLALGGGVGGGLGLVVAVG